MSLAIHVIQIDIGYTCVEVLSLRDFAMDHAKLDEDIEFIFDELEKFINGVCTQKRPRESAWDKTKVRLLYRNEQDKNEMKMGTLALK